MNTSEVKKTLLICFSLSGQTSNLLARLANGLESAGISVTTERLRPLKPLRFPFGSIRATVIMMLVTFFRSRMPIAPLSDRCRDGYDLIILAGPTWSYHPSGPVLALLDRDGSTLFANQAVIPLISCRGYWRMHWYGLRSLLQKNGASVANRIVFTHAAREPWRTLGVFLKLAGKSPERSKFIGRYYPRYGHEKKQLEEAYRFGAMLGRTLAEGKDLSALNFQTPVAIIRGIGN
ncbi:MAG: hypothetical protein HY885_15850 [Deltaproteobacteria bacterium]|nr:hypothetical protein [Deltaproteobacteria bacterium]